MRIVLSSTSSVPMYEQIHVQIRNAIHGGDLVADALLPSLRQLAAELRVSVITVTRAYNELVNEGLVRNEHGRGFVVRPIARETAETALTTWVDTAVDEVVASARAARMTIGELQRKVEDKWNRP